MAIESINSICKSALKHGKRIVKNVGQQTINYTTQADKFIKEKTPIPIRNAESLVRKKASTLAENTKNFAKKHTSADLQDKFKNFSECIGKHTSNLTSAAKKNKASIVGTAVIALATLCAGSIIKNISTKIANAKADIKNVKAEHYHQG